MRCSGCWPFTLDKPADKKPTDKQLPDPEQTGLKLLYAGPDPKIDIVAVHGLNGHHKKSWTASNGVNWLVDLLPADLPNMRVYTWGYDASAGGNADGTPSLQRISEELVSKLWETRESTRTDSLPIIFIAHSLGGNIVKSALLYSNSAEGASAHLHNISQSTHGIFFMGTPELDSRLAGLQRYLASTKGSDQESSDIYKEACWQLDLLHQYSSISEQFRSINVYEGPSIQVSQSISIDTDHGGLIKFESPLDDGYLEIKQHLLDMLKDVK